MINVFMTPQIQRVFELTEAKFSSEKFAKYMAEEFLPKNKIEYECIIIGLIDYIRLYFAMEVSIAIQNKLGVPNPPNIACDGYGFHIPKGYIQPEGVTERIDEVNALLRG